jgi:hypothetical protein
MKHLMLESCVYSWDPNNVYKDKCKRFVSIGHEPLPPSTIEDSSRDGTVHTSHLYLTSHTAFSEVCPVPDIVITVICAPGYGWSYHPKHVERFTEI